MGDFNNRLLFENNRSLFSYCLLNCFMGDKALMEEDKVVMGDPPVPPLGKPWSLANTRSITCSCPPMNFSILFDSLKPRMNTGT